MKKFIPIMLVSFAMLSCSVSDTIGPGNENNNVATHAFLPPADIFFDLPSSISHSSPSPVAASLFKRAAENPDSVIVVPVEEDLPVTHYSSNVDLNDVYLPVTKYVHHAEQAKKAIADFIREISTWEMPEDGEINFENWVIRTRSADSLFGALNVEFHSVVISQNSQVVLYMNYFKNERGEYRGNFFYNSVENPGTIVLIRYNGFNADILGKRMAVTYHNPAENLVESNDPSVVRIVTTKRGDRVFVRGFSYHPLFEDPFFGNGPHLYVFNAAVSSDKNNAVLRVSFVPTESQSQDIFAEYSLDRVVLRRGLNVVADSLANNPLFARAFLWSIETEQAIDESRYAEIALYTPEGTIEDIDVDDLMDFLEINSALVENDPNLQHFYEFVNARQAVVLSANGTFVGAYGALLPEELEDLGVDYESLEDYFPAVADLVEEINELLVEDEDDDLTEEIDDVVEEIDELFEDADEELLS